jgi:hypothetical protein
MKKNIFYQLKSIREHCLTFSSCFNAGFSSLFWTNAFAKKHSFYNTLLLLVFSQASLYGQLVGSSAVKANFGVEADAYANRLQFPNTDGATPVFLTPETGTDDWFVNQTLFPGSGKGVINQTPPVLPNNNTAFTRGQSVNTPAPGFQYPIVDGRLWIDAVYGRDTNSAQGNSDSSIFTSTSDKNPDNPSTWNLGSGSVPQKDDIIDVMAHLRGEGPKIPTEADQRPFETLWAFAGATLRATSGSKHIDFEFYRTLVSYTPGGSQFGNTGTDGGRTAWTFDATGNILVSGGIVVSIDYENGGTKPDVRIRVWMDETVFNGLNAKADRPFDVIPGSFEKGELSGTFGYGRILQKAGGIGTSIFGRVNNTASTLGPPWGTQSGPAATFSNDFQQFQFVEIGINLTAFGLDRRGSSDPCANILGSILVKTRSCAGGNNDPFTCEQKDFAGPFPFGITVAPAVTANVNRTITCTIADATILATNIAPVGATIEWYGPYDNVNNNKGPLIPGDNLQDPDRVVTAPGIYTVRAVAPGFFGCFAEATVEVLRDITPPPCTISGTDDNFCPSSTGHIYTGPAGQSAYAWSIISGNATIVGSSTSQSVSVTAGSPCGNFVLQLITTGANGCTSTCNRTLHIVDTTPPVITFCPPGSNLGCNPTGIPGAGTATATDNCGTPTIGSVLGAAVNTGGCNWSRTRTYTATDACGNTATCAQVFTYVIDTTPPVFTFCPPGSNLGCNPTGVPAAGTATATDVCSTPTITSSLGSITSDGCLRSQTRTYTATDACLNTATCTQVFTWTVDVTPPVFTFCPPGSNLGCNPTGVPAAGTATATDACGAPTITSSLGSITSDGCLRSQTRTYTATDGCLNTATCTQVFTWTVDVTPPVFTFCPPGSNLGCNPTGVPAPGTATATDACSTPTITSSLGSITSDGCLRSQTRTYTATDGCLNTTTCTQVFTWTVDVTPPVFTFCPPGSNLGCNPTGVPAPGTATVTDACSTPSITSSLSSITSDGCLRSQTRTYTATDACLNTATCTQVFTWTVDVTPPVFTFCPPGSNLGCNPTGVPVAGTATATDACGTPSITSSLGSITSDGCLRSQTRTYTATDGCLNTATCTQVFTWTVDVTPPVFTFCPPGSNLGCNPTGVPAAGTATATDACSTPTITSSLGSITSDGCLRSQTRTYTATDGCLNTATCTQVFTWKVDITPPTITCAANKTIECNVAFNFDPPTATDTCDGTITPTIVSTVTNADGSQTRTWRATDICGNQATCTQTISVASCAHIFPTETSCTDFSTGTAGLPKVCTTVTGKTVTNATPGVFFYYSFVTVPAGAFTIDVKQINDNELSKLFAVQGYDKGSLAQIRLYTSSCGTVSFTPSFIDNGSGARLTGTNTSGASATYIVSIKYDVKSIIDATYSGADLISTYTFASYINGSGTAASGSTGNINAEACSSNTVKIAPIAPTASKTTDAGFDAYPVPFRDQLTIKYKFDYKSDVKIEVFNAQGMSVLTKTDTNSYLDKEVTLDLKTSKKQEQVYLVKVTTNRGSTTKKVMSSK